MSRQALELPGSIFFAGRQAKGLVDLFVVNPGADKEAKQDLGCCVTGMFRVDARSVKVETTARVSLSDPPVITGK